ncbi:MAG: AAA family ATPase, partial [Dysgonamonadaceae bacterium]|nr:AAA family ATPase [Dysgonamonadaceae bacterium]
MNTIKRLPYGCSNFETIAKENYCYVDKTKYIEMLEKEPNHFHFFIRPRKFGKSLFFSTLYNYYDIRKSGDFQTLFGELYIGKYPTPKHNDYFVLMFDFSGLDTTDEDTFRVSFFERVQQNVIAWIDYYFAIIPNAGEKRKEIKNSSSGNSALTVACDIVQAMGRKIFVIIDEYDHFANDLIAMGVDDVYKKYIRANGLVRDFYERLKDRTKTVVDRIFIT